MNLSLVALALLVLTAVGYLSGRRRALAVAGGGRLHSLPRYYGAHLAIWVALPAFAVLALWMAIGPDIVAAVVMDGLSPELGRGSAEARALVLADIRELAGGGFVGREPGAELAAAAERYAELSRAGRIVAAVAALGLGLSALAWRLRGVTPELRARNRVERAVRALLIVCSTVAVLITIGIVLSLLFETIRFFRLVPFAEFLFGTEWSPQTAIREDQFGSSGAFGAIPLFAGTLLITLIAMIVAVPVGLFSAIWMSEYAHPSARAIAKPLLEILAGVPTVVYGFFAALTVAPALRGAGATLGLDVASESALAAGAVMGIMIIPFVSSLSDDVMSAVPRSLRDGALALGATRSETIRQIIVPAALPGIVGAVLLAVSRAIGETMIVVMAAGLAANLTANPFAAVTTVTVQMVTLLVGDQEFDSAKTLAAFALGLVLFVMTLALNVVALRIVQAYREKYD
jgi:phosphate transport system permease protein